MSEELKPGDVVRLKSGGPAMTIDNIGKYGMGADEERALCVWFAQKERKQEVFRLGSLEKADSPGGSTPVER